MVEAVIALDWQLGRDMNGSTLLSERHIALDRAGVGEGPFRDEVALRLLAAANQTRAEHLSEKTEGGRRERSREQEVEDLLRQAERRVSRPRAGV